MIRLILPWLAVLGLAACATTSPKPAPPEPAVPPIASGPGTPPIPDISNPVTDRPAPDVSAPTETADAPVRAGRPEAFSTLEGWDGFDASPALAAFKGRCQIWDSWRDHKNPLFAQRLPAFGQTSDWLEVCDAIDEDTEALTFFETWFLPFQMAGSETPGLLTGYYEPEIEVRSRPDLEFSEAILARPPDMVVENDQVWRQTATGKAKYPVRADVGPALAPIIAFGRPLDVFFMQIQGSGRLRFENGGVKRAAYNGHNGHEYTSIGGVLIRRGILTRDTASKSAIENWMRENGRDAARELINQNDRYIFFKTEDVLGDEGPKGAARVPLISMASMAVDDDYLPYGVPVWLETTLPQEPGDFRGAPQQLLVIALDTGGAIKGRQRGDLYFGSGDAAGKLAGVMKHDATWTLLLPKKVIARLNPNTS